MGIFWWTSKDKIMTHELQQQLRKGGPMLDWLKSHKALIGILVTALAAGLSACTDPHCQTAYHWLVVLGPTLIGAGVLPADVHVQQAQDFAAKGGVDNREVK